MNKLLLLLTLIAGIVIGWLLSGGESSIPNAAVSESGLSMNAGLNQPGTSAIVSPTNELEPVDGDVLSLEQKITRVEHLIESQSLANTIEFICFNLLILIRRQIMLRIEFCCY